MIRRNTKPAQLQLLPQLLCVVLLVGFGPCGTLALDYATLCGGNTLTLTRNPGDSLQPQGGQTAVTFVLNAGTYTLPARVNVAGGATACYEAAPGAAVTIKRAASFFSTHYLFTANNANAKLGLKGITLDGDGSGPAAQTGGVAILNGATLVAQDTTIRNFYLDSFAGVYVSDASLYLTNVVLERNTAGGSGGGAGLLYARAGSLNNVAFIGNSADTGGGLYSLASDPVIYSGLIRFVDNTATTQGGGVYVADGVCALAGAALCAEGNSAPRTGGGGFAYVDVGATLQLGGSAQQNAADNTANAIVIASTGAVTCSSAGSPPSSWRRPGSYSVTGAMCGCTQAFAEAGGSTTTCNTCGTLGWDTAACACAVPASVSLAPRQAAVACGQQLAMTAQVLSTAGAPVKGVAVQVVVVEEDDERSRRQGADAATAGVDQDAAAADAANKPADVALVPSEGHATSAPSYDVPQQLLLAAAASKPAHSRVLTRTMAVTNAQGVAIVVLTARTPWCKLTVLAAAAPGGGAPLLTATSHIEVKGGPHCGCGGHGHGDHGRKRYDDDGDL